MSRATSEDLDVHLAILGIFELANNPVKLPTGRITFTSSSTMEVWEWCVSNCLNFSLWVFSWVHFVLIVLKLALKRHKPPPKQAAFFDSTTRISSVSWHSIKDFYFAGSKHINLPMWGDCGISLTGSSPALDARRCKVQFRTPTLLQFSC